MAKKKKAAAKRRPTARRGKPIADPATGQLLIFNPATGAATPAAQSPKLSPAAQRRLDERERQRKQASREWRAARTAARNAWKERRQSAMRRRGYRLPDEVAMFLSGLHQRPSFYHRETHVAVEQVIEIAAAAYMEGCRQGYIEGRVADLEPKRKVSRKANAAKRQKVRDCGGHMMTLDQRDAAIVAEYQPLRAMLGSIDAQLRLAEKYGLSSREQVGNIIRKAKQNGTA
jgi:hypothetical protein